MENTLKSDIFKFTALRQAVPIKITSKSEKYIVDKRSVDSDANIIAQFVKGQGSVPDTEILKNLKTQYSDVYPKRHAELTLAAEEIQQHFTQFNRTELVDRLNQILDGGLLLYANSANSKKEEMFDSLYYEYMLKRSGAVNLDNTINSIRALTVIESLSNDIEVIENILNAQKGCLLSIVSIFKRKQEQSMMRYNFSQGCLNLGGLNWKEISLQIRNEQDLRDIFQRKPLIDPLFTLCKNVLSGEELFNAIKPLGIADLKVVKQELIEYRPGEIAHIENVLKGESKERSHRRLDRTEDIFYTLTETNEETEKETQTTSRFELKTEAEKTIQTDLSVQAGATVNYYGPSVQATANASFAYNQQTEETSKVSSNYAKDILDRSLSRIQKRVREERTTKKLHEIEEINRHALNNTNGSKHISGIYRWVDKVYNSQIYNYGKRMMFEFVIPEPAAFYIFAQEKFKNGNVNGIGKKPKTIDEIFEEIKKTIPAILFDHKGIDDNTLSYFIKEYNIQGVSLKPKSVYVFESFSKEDIPEAGAVGNQPQGNTTVESKNLTIPDGYEIDKVGCIFSRTVGWSQPNLIVHIGEQSFICIAGNPPVAQELDLNPNIEVAKQSLPVTIHGYDLVSFALHIKILCVPSASLIEKWQIDTYQKIVAAYQTAQELYEDKLNALQSRQGIEIKGRNPKINQEIIRNELKKHSITMIAKQFDTKPDFDTFFDALKPDFPIGPITGNPATQQVKTKIPAIDIDDAKEEGKLIQFLEQAFEWQQLTYLFYPYFWGRIEEWTKSSNRYDEADPLFSQFLQAGSVRVVVPVTWAYNEAIMHYLCTGKPWEGGEVPAIDSELYLPIYEELKDQQDDLTGAKPEGKSWEVVVPTSLVYLQDSTSALPTFNKVI
jgi:hypothetical protein